MQNFLRIENDMNGNPRYYIGWLEMASLLNVDANKLESLERDLRLTNYKGKKYGKGYILQSYNLKASVQQIKFLLDRILILEAKMPEYPIRVHCGRIEQKISNRWKPYSDHANNWFVNL